MKEILSELNDHSTDCKNREIFVHRYYNNSEDYDIENKISAQFIKNLRTLDHKEAPILIHLNAGAGGEWEAGMAMYDAIQFTKSQVIMLIYGYACSMSSIIPQAADLRIIMPNAYMMCHYGYESVDNTHVNNKKYFHFASTLRKTMVNIYTEKMQYGEYFQERGVKDVNKYTRNYIVKKLEHGDWYMGAEDAHYYGLVDGVLGSDDYPNMESIKNVYW